MRFLRLTLSYKNAADTDVHVNFAKVLFLEPTRDGPAYYAGTRIVLEGSENWIYVRESSEQILAALRDEEVPHAADVSHMT